MVDFKSEATISTPALGVVKMLFLEARYNVMEAYEEYLKQRFGNVQPKYEVVQSRLWRLYKELEPSLRRHMKEPELVDIQEKIKSHDPENIDLVLTILNDHCDKIELTRVDLRKSLGGNIRQRNLAQGWKS